MATGASKVAFAQKRILGLADFSTNFMDYLDAQTRDLFALTYSQGGVFVSSIALSAGGNDMIDLATGIETTDGDGHILTLTPALGVGIQFANVLGVTYYVGLHHAYVKSGLQINPRTGLPEFKYDTDTIGESGIPDNVVNNGATLTMVVDSVTEVGVSNAGRQIAVYKNNPGVNATTEGVAIETATVVWDGVNNKITTAAQFGQVGSISTTAADYTVVCLGPTVSKNTDLSITDSYAFIGTVIGTGAGNPPAVFNVTNQNRIDTTLTGLDQITKTGTNGDLKISVDGHALDSNENQIEVLDLPGGSVVFSVDEDGDVIVGGTLSVIGTATFSGTLQTLTNLIVANNATIGNADGDLHIVQGTFRHTSTGFGGTVFTIDGATGIIAVNSVMYINQQIFLNPTGSIFAAPGSDINLLSGATITLGAGATIVGDVIPDTATQDLGAVSSEWQDGHFLGNVRINKSSGEGVAALVIAEDATDSFQLEARFAGAGSTGNFIGWRGNGGVPWQAADTYGWLMRGDGAIAIGLDAAEADIATGVPLNIAGTQADATLAAPETSVRMRITNRSGVANTKTALQFRSDGAADDGTYLVKHAGGAFIVGHNDTGAFTSAMNVYEDGAITFGIQPGVRLADSAGNAIWTFLGDVGGNNSWRDNTAMVVGDTVTAAEVGFGWASIPSLGIGNFWWNGINESAQDLSWHVFDDTQNPTAGAVAGTEYMRLDGPTTFPGTPADSKGLVIFAGRAQISPGSAAMVGARNANNAIGAYGTVSSGGAILHLLRRWNYASSTRNSVGNYSVVFEQPLTADYSVFFGANNTVPVAVRLTTKLTTGFTYITEEVDGAMSLNDSEVSFLVIGVSNTAP